RERVLSAVSLFPGPDNKSLRLLGFCIAAAKLRVKIHGKTVRKSLFCVNFLHSLPAPLGAWSSFPIGHNAPVHHDDAVGTVIRMNVIFVGRKSGRVKQFDLRHPMVVAAALLVVFGIVGGAFSIGVGLGARHGAASPLDKLGNWSAELLSQQAQIEDVKRVLQEKVNALALRVGQMNANVIRVNALGKRLTRMANISDGEFDFGNPPALGGADSGADGQPVQIPSLTTMVDDLQTQLSSREQQLGVLENLILTRELNKQVYP